MPFTSTPVEHTLFDKTSGEFFNTNAFAALRSDGSVVTWGSSEHGGNSSIATINLSTYEYDYIDVSSQLTEVTEVFSNYSAFAALKGTSKISRFLRLRSA